MIDKEKFRIALGDMAFNLVADARDQQNERAMKNVTQAMTDYLEETTGDLPALIEKIFDFEKNHQYPRNPSVISQFNARKAALVINLVNKGILEFTPSLQVKPAKTAANATVFTF